MLDLRLTFRQIVLQGVPDIKKRQAGVEKTSIEGDEFVQHRVQGSEGSRFPGAEGKIITLISIKDAMVSCSFL